MYNSQGAKCVPSTRFPVSTVHPASSEKGVFEHKTPSDLSIYSSSSTLRVTNFQVQGCVQRRLPAVINFGSVLFQFERQSVLLQ